MATKKSINLFETVTTITQNVVDDSNKLATTEYVKDSIQTVNSQANLSILKFSGFFTLSNPVPVLKDATGASNFYGSTFYVVDSGSYNFGTTGVPRNVSLFKDDLIIYDSNLQWKRNDDFIGFNLGDSLISVPTSELFLNVVQNKQNKIENISSQTILGRKTTGTGDLEILTKSDIKTMLGYLETNADFVTLINAQSPITTNIGDYIVPIIHDTSNALNYATLPIVKNYVLDGLVTDISNKVDKVTGYVLTKNDLSDALKTAYDNVSNWFITNGTNLVDHLSNTSNPHSVTKTQVGLSNVPNTDCTNASNLSSGTIDNARLPVIDISKIPPSALERLYLYTGAQTLPENFGLTTGDVQNGDTVKVSNGGNASNGLMWIIKDDTLLNVAGSFEAYSVGTASSVPWSGITSKPTTISGFGITDFLSQVITGFVSGAGTVAATDTILQVFNKIVGNIANKQDVISSTMSFINSLTGKTTPVDADTVVISDSADSNYSKSVSLTNLWLNYFKGKADALYSTKEVVQNSQSADYTLVVGDSGKHIYHPVGDNNARTFTIPANSSVAFGIGTVITFVNMINTVTIAITTDTLTLSSAGTTGSRTLAANGVATALKVTSTSWIISGTGLT